MNGMARARRTLAGPTTWKGKKQCAASSEKHHSFGVAGTVGKYELPPSSRMLRSMTDILATVVVPAYLSYRPSSKGRKTVCSARALVNIGRGRRGKSITGSDWDGRIDFLFVLRKLGWIFGRLCEREAWQRGLINREERFENLTSMAWSNRRSAYIE